MSKKHYDYYHIGDFNTYCTIKWKKYMGVGSANFNKEGIEDHPTRLMGETVAHLKAERDLLKQKLSDKKEHLKYLEDFINYLFPSKYDKTLSDWLYPRSDKYIEKLKDNIKYLEKEIKEIDDTLVKYLNNKRTFLKKLSAKRKQKNDSNSN